MNSLHNFKGSWDAHLQEMNFSWDAKGMGNDKYIIIVEVIGQGSSMQVNRSNYFLRDVRSLPGNGNSLTVKMQSNSGGVHRRVFCGVSFELHKEAEDSVLYHHCVNNSDCFIKVITGRADVSWSTSSTIIDDYKIVTMDITTNSDISEGALGYRYSCGKDLEIRMPFSFHISAGKHTGIGPILIPKDCEVAITPYDQQFAGNFVIKKKKNIFGF